MTALASPPGPTFWMVPSPPTKFEPSSTLVADPGAEGGGADLAVDDGLVVVADDRVVDVAVEDVAVADVVADHDRVLDVAGHVAAHVAGGDGALVLEVVASHNRAVAGVGGAVARLGDGVLTEGEVVLVLDVLLEIDITLGLDVGVHRVVDQGVALVVDDVVALVDRLVGDVDHFGEVADLPLREVGIALTGLGRGRRREVDRGRALSAGALVGDPVRRRQERSLLGWQGGAHLGDGRQDVGARDVVGELGCLLRSSLFVFEQVEQELENVGRHCFSLLCR